MKPIYAFRDRLCSNALHIDYLRLRCGREPAFEQEIAKVEGIRAQIAFSEWDVVLLIPSTKLYPENLIGIYSDKAITDTIAGSTGFFNYLWDHKVNKDWPDRIIGRRKSSFSMLISVRFTDDFRRKLGIGAELLFCSFLEKTLSSSRFSGITAIVAHSVGWNDATVLLDAQPGSEKFLVEALTAIRFCKEVDCMVGGSNAGVIAATYSHLLGGLAPYSQLHELPFDVFGDRLKTARFLIRVNPDSESALRDELKKLLVTYLGDQTPEDRLGLELGHYNFSADIDTILTDTGDTPPARRHLVEIVQGFRETIGRYVAHRPEESSFPETTTEITFRENVPDIHPPDADAAHISKDTLSSLYKSGLQTLLSDDLEKLKDRASAMTRHRLAILLGTIITYLDDPVRGSVVAHLCRFLTAMFKSRLRESDRAGQEDLCHIVEYALQQATEGLTQFQHDANSLGLSGRGGYTRLIQAVEEFIDQVLRPFQLELFPLITFGLRPSSEGTSLQYWIDLPFSTAFVPERWYIAYHDLAQMCWHHTFEWRLDSYQVWQEFSSSITDINSHNHQDDRMQFLLGRDVVDDLFPSYLLRNIVASDDAGMLDQLMVAKEFLTRPRPTLIHDLTVRLALHVLLSMHDSENTGIGETRLDRFRGAVKREELSEDCTTIAFEWWDVWWSISESLSRVRHDGKSVTDEDRRISYKVGALVEDGAKSLRKIIDSLKDQDRYSGRDVAEAFESTAMLVATQTFKMDALRVVERVIRLLALRGQDYKARSEKSFELFDPSAVEFGFMIAKIQVMRQSVRNTKETDVAAFRKAIEDGTVFATGPEPPTLARILTASGETTQVQTSAHPSMISSMSSILSMWHTAVTKDLRTREVPTELLSTLKELELIDEWQP